MTGNIIKCKNVSILHFLRNEIPPFSVIPISPSDMFLTTDVMDFFLQLPPLPLLVTKLSKIMNFIVSFALFPSHKWSSVPGLARIENMYIFKIGARNKKECKRISTNPSSLQGKQLSPHTLWMMGQQNVFQLKGQHYGAWDIIRFYGIKINISTLQLKA